jgi:hydrogenase-4 component C
MISASAIALGLMQALLVLLAAPIYSGFSRVMRAKMHNRRGPGILQNYLDLAKLMKRQEVISEQSGWIFRATPYILMSMLLDAAIVRSSF